METALHLSEDEGKGEEEDVLGGSERQGKVEMQRREQGF